MLLAIDIGNTKCALGVFDDSAMVQQIRFSTPYGTDAEELKNSIRIELAGKDLQADQLEGSIISSVVPGMNPIFESSLSELLGTSPIFVSSDLDFGFRIKYNLPSHAGTDRIVDAFAASRKYGSPLIVCDFGTATKIDAVNSDGDFIGGTIAPGMMMMAESLYQKTAKLPQVDIFKPTKVIGDSTENAIRSGIYWGHIALVEGIVSRMKDELGGEPKVVATGGLLNMIAAGTKLIDIVDDDLLLEGLNMIYRRLNTAAD